MFADDAAVKTHTQKELQALMDRVSPAYKEFGLTISLKKTNVLGHDTMELPAIIIDDYELDVVEQFTYLGSIITDNLSLDTEIDKRTGKAATTLARLTSRVWTNPKLTVKTKMVVYNAFVVSTLMYGSETRTTSARQEKRLNSFHLRSIRRILGIPWQDRVSNTEILSRGNLPSMFTLLRQRRLRWLGHVYRMEDGRIPKDILYGELASGRRSKGRPQLHYEDVCKRDVKALDINTNSWEDLAADRMMWRSTLNQHLKTGEKKLVNVEAGRRAGRKERNNSNRPETTHKINATSVAEIVSPTSVSTTTSDAATIEQTGQPGCTRMIKVDRGTPYMMVVAVIVAVMIVLLVVVVVTAAVVAVVVWRWLLS